MMPIFYVQDIEVVNNKYYTEEEIVEIFEQFLEAGHRLSREVCKKIIDDYKAGLGIEFVTKSRYDRGDL